MRAGEDGEGGVGGDRVPAAPLGELDQVVGAHQPDEAGAGEQAVQMGEGVGGVTGAEAVFEVGGDDASAVGEGSRGGKPGGEGGHAGDGLQGVSRGDQQPDLVEAESAAGHAGDVEMAGMGGVEGAAEQADGDAAAVAEAGEFARLQGRTWPVPVTW